MRPFRLHVAPLVESHLFAQEQVLRRQLRVRRHRQAGKGDDIEQEAADRGGPSASAARHGASMPLSLASSPTCPTEHLPRHIDSDVVFAEDKGLDPLTASGGDIRATLFVGVYGFFC